MYKISIVNIYINVLYNEIMSQGSKLTYVQHDLKGCKNTNMCGNFEGWLKFKALT